MKSIRLRNPLIIVLSYLCCGALIEGSAVAAAPTSPNSRRMSLTSFTFVENRGQADASVRYIGLGPEFRAWFEDRSVVFQGRQAVVRVTFAGQSPSRGVHPTIRAANPTGAHSNFLRGSDRRHWQTDITQFGAIHYSGIWPGIELTYKADQGRLEAEYLVTPGAAVDGIQLSFDGEARIQGDGTLRITGAAGDLIEDKPVLYQTIKGHRVEVAGAFRKFLNGSLGFQASEYDRTQPLVIDPSILFSGYFGGDGEDTITSVGIDSQNNVVVAGWTSSPNLPATNGAQKIYGGSVDAFIASFLPNGGPLIYCTYLGGSGEDQALGLALDSARNVYITGWTSSTNFPLAGAFQSHLKGTRDAFVAKLNAAGNSLIYSTYLGGSGVDTGNAIAVDAFGGAVIVGDSTSTDMPVTLGVVQARNNGSQDAFVAYFSPAGNTLKFVTYLGGSGTDHAGSVAVGGNGNVLIGGYTWSTNFPTVLPFQPASGGGQDGFVAKLWADGTYLKFSTYLGGSGGSVGAPEAVNGLFIDASGNVTVAGVTSSANFPVTAGAFQTVFGGETDGFITRFSSTGALLESTFLGGSLSDSITAIAPDFAANPYVTGFTVSQDFPVQNPSQSANAGAMDAFVVKLNTTLSSIVFSTYLGGSGNDQGNAIAVDGETSMIVAGQTGSGNLPVAGSLQNYLPTFLTSFITKIKPNFTLGVAYGYEGQLTFTADPWHVGSYPASTMYGEATDLPIVGDWTGSGTKRIGIFRNGTWILDTNNDGVIDAGDQTVSFGQAGDVPVVGDWRGTGRIALGLFRQGTFILDLSGHLTGVPTGLSDATFTFGRAGDIPIVSDWNGSGTAKVGVFLNGVWLVDYTGGRVVSGLNRSYVYGEAGDIPVVGDWDSSGNPPKIGIYRAGLWILNYDGNNIFGVPALTEIAVAFGFAGYTPLVF
jgi:hypothetical protein